MVDEAQQAQTDGATASRAPPPIATGEDQGKREKKHRKHFAEHAHGIQEAAHNIGVISKKLRATNKVDEREDLHNQLDAETMQLGLSVNNALQAPVEHRENTGGAHNTDIVDPEDFGD